MIMRPSLPPAPLIQVLTQPAKLLQTVFGDSIFAANGKCNAYKQIMVLCGDHRAARGRAVMDRH
jgi:hypothetical protein